MDTFYPHFEYYDISDSLFGIERNWKIQNKVWMYYTVHGKGCVDSFRVYITFINIICESCHSLLSIMYVIYNNQRLFKKILKITIVSITADIQ